MARINAHLPGPRPTGPPVLVEISGALGEARLRDFLEAAYRVGAREALGLLVPRNLRGPVNRRLDPVVEHYGIGDGDRLFPGVLFLDPQDPDLAERARAARLVVATSLPFQRRLTRHGVAWVGEAEGLRALAALTARGGGSAAASREPSVGAPPGRTAHAASGPPAAASETTATPSAVRATASEASFAAPGAPTTAPAPPPAPPRTGSLGRKRGISRRRTPPSATGTGPAPHSP